MHLLFTFTLHIYSSHLLFTFTLHIYSSHLHFTFTLHIYSSHLLFTQNPVVHFGDLIPINGRRNFGPDTPVIGHGPAEDRSGHGNETVGSINCRIVLDHLLLDSQEGLCSLVSVSLYTSKYFPVPKSFLDIKYCSFTIIYF